MPRESQRYLNSLTSGARNDTWVQCAKTEQWLEHGRGLPTKLGPAPHGERGISPCGGVRGLSGGIVDARENGLQREPRPGGGLATARDNAPRTAPQPTDEQLVAAALAGERRAFEQLVRRHQRALVNHIYRHTNQRDGALDLAQEVFLKVYQSLSSFDPKYRFTTWLYRIASNCAIDFLRKKQPQTCSLHTDPSQDRGEGPARTLADTEPTPHDVLRLRELKHRLETRPWPRFPRRSWRTTAAARPTRSASACPSCSS